MGDKIYSGSWSDKGCVYVYDITQQMAIVDDRGCLEVRLRPEDCCAHCHASYDRGLCHRLVAADERLAGNRRLCGCHLYLPALQHGLDKSHPPSLDTQTPWKASSGHPMKAMSLPPVPWIAHFN